MLNDVRYSFRLLGKSPLFTLSVVLTVGLAVGATTAIFSVVNAVMLRPLPFAEPGRLVWMAERNDKLSIPQFATSYLNYQSWKERSRAFESVGAIGFATFNMSGDGDPELVQGNTLTPSVLPTLGLVPIAGRGFSEDDARAGGSAVVMLGENLWRRRYAADRGIVGRTILLDGAAAQVIGIVPRAIAPMTAADLFVPMRVDLASAIRLNHTLLAIGRLNAGISLDEAQREMDGVSRAMGGDYPEMKEWASRLVPFSEWIVGAQLRTSLWVLFGAISCVLLIACANVANLLLSRAAARDREMAVRTAMGAGRARLVRQLLVESSTMSLLGGITGLILAFLAVGLINAKLPAGLLPTGDVTIDMAVLWFALALTLAVGILFGLAPAWSASRADIGSVLKQASRGSTGGRRWGKNALASAELALATILLTGAGLLGQTLLQLERVPLGFRTDHLLTFEVSLPPSQYPLDSRALQFYLELAPQLKAIPGVTSVAVSSGLPFGLGNYTTTPMAATGESLQPADVPVPLNWRTVSADYFKTMGIPLLGGRVFTDADTSTSEPVILIGRSAARRFFGDADPIGRSLHRMADLRQFTIVGVAGDVRDTSLNQESLTMYFSSASRVWPLMDIALRVDGDSSSVLAAARAKVREIDRNISVANVRTMDDLVSTSASQPRLNAALLGVFAIVALIVAAIGVYGVLSFSVNQRTREIGLRLALGAPRSSVLMIVLREGAIVSLAGVVVGVGGASLLGRALRALVFGVPPRDPWTFAAVASTLTIVALAACLVPARKACRVDPLTALRHD